MYQIFSDKPNLYHFRGGRGLNSGTAENVAKSIAFQIDAYQILGAAHKHFVISLISW